MTTEKKTTRKRTTKATVVDECVKPTLELNKVEKTPVSRPKSLRELRKLLNRDTEVLIMNNTCGNFFYRCPKTGMELDMQDFGDTEVVTLELLEAMKNRARVLFKNFCIMIVDVYPDADVEDEINIEDVLTYLNIKDLYTPIQNELEYIGDIYSEEFFDSIIVEKNKDEFDYLVSRFNKQLLGQMAQRGVQLYKTGKFDSRHKIEKIEEILGLEDLFSDL